VRRSTSIYAHGADFRKHIEITLQDVPKLKYKLELFLGNEEIDLQRKANRTWTPVQRPYVICCFIYYTPKSTCICRGVSPTSQMRADIRMRSGHLLWTKKDQTSKLIDPQDVFNDFWASKSHDLTVQGQHLPSPASWLISDREVQRLLSLENIASL
jgi:hypothetical protein